MDRKPNPMVCIFAAGAWHLAAFTAHGLPVLKKTVHPPFTFAASCGLKNGGFALAGNTWDTTDHFGIRIQAYDSLGEPKWTALVSDPVKSAVVQKIIPTRDGGVAILGNGRIDAEPYGSPLVIKTDSLGRVQFWRNDTRGFAHYNAIAETADSGLVLAGVEFEYRYNSYLVKLDRHGDIAWSHAYSELSRNYSDYNRWDAVQETPDRGFILAGRSGASTVGVMAAKSDSEGNLQWGRRFTEGTATVSDVAFTPDGKYLVSGAWRPPDTQKQIGAALELGSDGETTHLHRFEKFAQDEYSAGPSLLHSMKHIDGGWIGTGNQPPYYCMMIKTDTTGKTIWEFPLGDITPPGVIPFHPIPQSPGKFVICPGYCFLFEDAEYTAP